MRTHPGILFAHIKAAVPLERPARRRRGDGEADTFLALITTPEAPIHPLKEALSFFFGTALYNSTEE